MRRNDERIDEFIRVSVDKLAAHTGVALPEMLDYHQGLQEFAAAGARGA